MARVVVVGGGFAGMAAAARLAKLGHEVSLLERGDRLGGALVEVRHGDFAWDGGPTAALLPAVVRDLFRKSGRPLERELETVQLDVLREHRFEDGTSLALPGGSRAAQIRAFDALGAGLGQRWVDHAHSYAEAWDVLRRGYLERPWDPAAPGGLPRELAAVLGSRQTLHRRLRRTFRDERLRLVAGHPHVAQGQSLRDVPAWLGVTAYLEQRFGGWRPVGGMAALVTALEGRLATRKVEVHTATDVHDVVVRDGRAVAVATAQGQVDADVVVCAVDPRRLPALAPYVERTMPALPPTVTHLGLEGPVPDLPPELVLHGDPLLVVRPGGRAPEGCSGWTVHARGTLLEDVLVALARHRLDVRGQVVARVDRSPKDLVEDWGGSPMGVLWQGRGTVHRRLGPRTPVAGVYAAGAHATPGAGIPFVGLSAALVAEAVGPA